LHSCIHLSLLEVNLALRLGFLLLDFNHHLYVLSPLVLLTSVLLQSLLSKLFVLFCLHRFRLGTFICVLLVGLDLRVDVLLHVEVHLSLHSLFLHLLVLSLQLHLLVLDVSATLHDDVSGALPGFVNLSNRLKIRFE
jgi:hypothetical protein